MLKAIKINNDFLPEQTREFNKAWNKIPNGSEFYFEFMTEKQYRSFQHHKYLFAAIYSKFVEHGHFNSNLEVHDYFSRWFLVRTDRCDLNSPDEYKELLVELRKVSKTVGIIHQEVIDNIFVVTWVKSSSLLTSKELNIYIDQITEVGSRMEIEFEEFDKNHDYRD